MEKNEGIYEMNADKLKELLKAYETLGTQSKVEPSGESETVSEKESAQGSAEGSQDWGARVNALVEKYPVAERFTKELGEELAKNVNKLNDGNLLENALLNVLSAGYKTADELAKDDKVVDLVLKNDANRQKVISEYLNAVTKQLPKTISNGGELPTAPAVKARTMEEARQLALNLFKKD